MSGPPLMFRRMETEIRSKASTLLPFKAYRCGSYVGNDVKVVILIMGSDDGSIGKLADAWTLPNGKADLAGMLSFPYVDTTSWDWGCEDRNEYSSSAAAVGFVDDFDANNMDAFAKKNPDLHITVSYESNRYTGVGGWRRGKRTDDRFTLSRWTCAETGYRDLPYEQFVAMVGEGSW